MTLNAYAVFALWSCAVRAALGGLVAVSAGRAWRRSEVEADRAAVEDRYYLLFLLALVLFGLVWLAWPLYYLVLASYVPSWPGAMCVYGITQIGRGSLGASRALPWLVNALEALKPAVAFVWGLWVITYLVNRKTATAPFTGRVFRLLALLGLLAVAEAMAEGAWLMIPKRETFVKVGCCTVARASHTISASIPPLWKQSGATAAVSVLHGGLVLGLILGSRRVARSTLPVSRAGSWPGRGVRWALGAGALLALVSGALFLRDTAAPWLTGLPHHRCLYCLLATRPETCVTALALVSGCFLTGWFVGLARLTGGMADGGSAMPAWRRRLGGAAAVCLGGYAMMIAWQMVLAKW